MGIQPALCLGEMQVKGPGLKLAASNLMSSIAGAIAGRLSSRDQRRCQRFRDDPFVVAGNSFFWHADPHPLPGQRSNVRPAL